MRVSKFCFLLLAPLVLLSCNDNKKKSEGSDQYVSETPDYNMDNKADDEGFVENAKFTTNSNEQEGSLDTDSMKDMYQYLDMSENQVQRFEEDYNFRLKVLRENNKESSLDGDKMQQAKDESLQSFLTTEQYRKYEQWKKDHPTE